MLIIKFKNFLKKFLPKGVYRLIHIFFLIIAKYYRFIVITGFLKSAWSGKAINKNGESLPWYTYSAIGFLSTRDFKGRKVLEFGAGQSTLWWSNRAEMVLSIEGDKVWFDYLNKYLNKNVSIHHLNVERNIFIEKISEIINSEKINKFDVIVIDGLYREELIDWSQNYLTDTGLIICDNSEGYEIYSRTKEKLLRRVDFFGSAPGVLLEQNTSIFFGNDCFLFDPKNKIQSRWNQI